MKDKRECNDAFLRIEASDMAPVVDALKANNYRLAQDALDAVIKQANKGFSVAQRIKHFEAFMLAQKAKKDAGL